MNRYGVIVIIILPIILGGVVYMGMNAEKFTGGFGEPSYISSQFTPPSNDLPPFSFPEINWETSSLPSMSFEALPSFSVGSSYNIDVDKIQAQIERKILSAQSPQELDDIIKEVILEPFKDPRASAECKQVLKDTEREQQKMSEWIADRNHPYSYPSKDMQKVQDLIKMSGLCAGAYKEGLIDDPRP